MPDPLSVLRSPDDPVAPDPSFAARLRARLERALTLPGGAPVSHPAVTPYLAVLGAEEAMAFYAAAFGASVTEGPIVMPDGRVGHAGLRLAGGAELMLADAHPEIGVIAPAAAGNDVTLHLEVEDVDAALATAVAAGAAVDREAADHPHGRNAVVRDPFGHRWMLSSAVATGVAFGSLGYASLWTPSSDRAARFYAFVLGWRLRGPVPGHGGYQVTGQSLSHGLTDHSGPPTLFCCYSVDDLDAALARVVAAGGSHRAPTDEPHGRVALCADDQDRVFALYLSVNPGSPATSGATPHGDLAYLTYRVASTDRFRAFFGAVLGWEFAPGRMPDAWQIGGTSPAGGVSGIAAGADATVPMYAVDDVDVAAERVRIAGGTAGPVEDQPYGRTALCADDQGTGFYLGQLLPD